MMSDQKLRLPPRPSLSLAHLETQLKRDPQRRFHPEAIGRIRRLRVNEIETHIETAKLGDVCFVRPEQAGQDKAFIVIEQAETQTRLVALSPLTGVTLHDRVRLGRKYNHVGIGAALIGSVLPATPLQNWDLYSPTSYEPLWPIDPPEETKSGALEAAQFWLEHTQIAVNYGDVHDLETSHLNEEAEVALLQSGAFDLAIFIGAPARAIEGQGAADLETPDGLMPRIDLALANRGRDIDRLLGAATAAALGRGFARSGMRVLLLIGENLSSASTRQGAVDQQIFSFDQILAQAGHYDLGSLTLVHGVANGSGL